MKLSEYIGYDATALATLVRNREVSEAQLAACAAMAVEDMNPHINAVLEIFADVIEDPGKDGMNSDGPFHGVPMLVKDIGSGMRGRLQESGAKFLQGARRLQDDPLVLNWRHAGFNLIGRTSLPAMGCAGVSDGLLHGTTHNPWHLDYSPGGSSGGSAAAVAAGITPIASASDSGGSIRGPAGFNGLIGLKPTRGLLPAPAGNNEFAQHLAVEGVLTRSLRDAAQAYDHMIRHQPGDSFMPVRMPQEPFSKILQEPPAPLRIALSTGPCQRKPAVDQEIAERIISVAKLLDSLGHDVEEVDADAICEWHLLWRGSEINWIGMTQFWPALAARHGHRLTEENCESLFRCMIEAGTQYNFADYRQMQLDNGTIARQFGALFQRHDVWLTPVEAAPPPKCGPQSNASPLYPVHSAAAAVDFVQRLNSSGRYMLPANDTGFPAIAVPVGLDSNDLPIGAQLAAAWCQEGVLFQLAAQLEQAEPGWFNRLAPLNAGSCPPA